MWKTGVSPYSAVIFSVEAMLPFLKKDCASFRPYPQTCFFPRFKGLQLCKGVMETLCFPYRKSTSFTHFHTLLYTQSYPHPVEKSDLKLLYKNIDVRFYPSVRLDILCDLIPSVNDGAVVPSSQGNADLF